MSETPPDEARLWVKGAVVMGGATLLGKAIRHPDEAAETILQIGGGVVAIALFIIAPVIVGACVDGLIPNEEGADE